MGTSKRALPQNLSPKARKRLLTAGAGDVSRALVQVAPTADPAELGRQVTALGGTVHSWLDETSLLSLELPTSRLVELAALDGVVYVETGEPYRSSPSESG
jgi:hypothetical protein